MGSNTSKPNNGAIVHTQSNESSDPRSPTPEISRTPLQGKPGAKHNITKNVDLRKSFEDGKVEEKLIHNNPILSAVIKNHLQSYDPRSPTQDFERTPIVISSKADDKNLLREQTENCGSAFEKLDEELENYDSCTEAHESPEILVPKNLCNGFFDLTLNDSSIKETDEPLGSSTASNDALEKDLSNQIDPKPTELLETNFDYIDTDQQKYEDSQESCEVTDNVEETAEKIEKIPLFRILPEDPRSPSTGIERTPIVVAKGENKPKGAVEEMSDDTLIKVLQNTNAELRQSGSNKDNDDMMIYEDETSNINDTPKKSRSANCSGSRTPLSCVKNKAESGHSRSKSANTFADSKDQKTKRVSHIPRLKSLSKQTKLSSIGTSISLKSISKTSAIGGDCENTPPHSHRDRWDKDTSIVL